MNRKTHLKTATIAGLCLCLVSLLFLTPVATQAQGVIKGVADAINNKIDDAAAYSSQKTYTPLAPIPGLTEEENFTAGSQGNVDLGRFFSQAYIFIVGVASVIAVLMIISAGAQKIFSAASASGVSEANDRIRNAIYGLLLILFSWIIINTINPEALKFKNILGENTTTTNGSSEGSEGTPVKPTYSFTYSRLQVNSDQNSEKSAEYQTSEQCNIERAKRLAHLGPKYDANESTCKPTTLQVGDQVYSFTYNTYTSPQNNYLPQDQKKEPRDIITQTYTDADPTRCEAQRTQIANRQVKTYLPIQNSCEKTLFGNYYFNYRYGPDSNKTENELTYEYFFEEDEKQISESYPNSKVYELVYPSKPFCDNVIAQLIAKTEGVATISAQCNPTYATEEFIKGTSRDLYCTNMIQTWNGTEHSAATECFITKTECLPVLDEKLKEQRPYYTATPCQPN